MRKGLQITCAGNTGLEEIRESADEIRMRCLRAMHHRGKQDGIRLSESVRIHRNRGAVYENTSKIKRMRTRGSCYEILGHGVYSSGRGEALDIP